MYVLCTRNFQDTELAKVNAIICKGFKREDGPFVKAADAALEGFNVRRQAYHSGSFVGNHVHLTLKVWYNNYYGNVQIHVTVLTAFIVLAITFLQPQNTNDLRTRMSFVTQWWRQQVTTNRLLCRQQRRSRGHFLLRSTFLASVTISTISVWSQRRKLLA